MDPLSITASIITVLQASEAVISICCNYRSSIQGSSWEVSRVLDETRSLRNVLRKLEELADKAEAGSKTEESSLPTLRQLCEPKSGSLAQCYEALTALEKKLTPPGWVGPDGSKRKRLAQALSWPLKRKETEMCLEMIEGFKSSLNMAISLDQASMIMAIHDITLDSSQNKHRKNIMAWLKAPSSSSRYMKALHERHVGTGVWYTHSEAFERWTKQPGSFSWLWGIPGCGKTVLSATIIEDLLNLCRGKSKSAVAYFYFAFDDHSAQNVEGMVRSLIFQLCSQCTPIPPVIESLYSRCSDGREKLNFDQLQETLRAIIDAFNEVYIVLDALDECTERHHLIPTLETIAQWKQSQLHVLATSRKERTLEECLITLTKNIDRIGIQGNLVENDIRAYILSRLRTDSRLRRLEKLRMEKEIETTLGTKADGMFQWVVCQLDTLSRCRTIVELRTSLKSLPKDLDETYARIFKAIDVDGNHQHVFKILELLIFSNRPVSIAQAAEIIPIELDSFPQFDKERRLIDLEDVLSMCSVLVTAETAADGVVEGTSILRLAHFSIQEFLLSERIRCGSSSQWYMDQVASHLSIAQAYIAYLLCLDHDNPKSEHISDDYHHEYPLARLAASTWPRHLEIAEKSGFTCGPVALQLFMADGPSYHLWLLLQEHCLYCKLYPDAYTKDKGGIWQGSLHLALHFKLPQTVSHLLSRGVNVNAKLDTGEAPGGKLLAKTPLYEAVRWGEVKVVQELLAHHADANHDANAGFDAIMRPSIRFQGLRRLRMLFATSLRSWGADKHYIPPIELAVLLESHLTVVQALLDHGADGAVGLVTAAFKSWRYPLRPDLVCFFLDYGVDVNARAQVTVGSMRSRSSVTALEVSCTMCYLPMVKLLLDKGANPNLCSETIESAFEIALNTDSESEFEEVQKLLLSHGADPKLVRPDMLKERGKRRLSELPSV